MHINQKYWFLAFLMLFCELVVEGQDILTTKTAQMVIKVKHHNAVSIIWTNGLNIMLNYDNATFESYVETDAVHVSDNMVKDVLDSLKDRYFELSGKFGMKYVQTTNHNPKEFDFEGSIVHGTRRIGVSGTGKLQHIGGGASYSCLLSFNFPMDKNLLPKKLVK